MVGFNRRFDPTFAEMRERVAGGEIGRLEQLLIISRDPAPAPAATSPPPAACSGT
jgi:Predicted dehydrogenases and related proteins